MSTQRFRIGLGLLLMISLTALGLDRVIIAEVEGACSLHISDPKLRQDIVETFEFRPFYIGRVCDLHEQEHPAWARLLPRYVNTAWINACLLPRPWARVDLIVAHAPVYGKNGERLRGLDAASRHWFHHGIESASRDELKVLHDHLAGSMSLQHPARWPAASDAEETGEGLNGLCNH